MKMELKKKLTRKSNLDSGCSNSNCFSKDNKARLSKGVSLGGLIGPEFLSADNCKQNVNKQLMLNLEKMAA